MICDSCGVELEDRSEMDPDDKLCLEGLLGELKTYCTECEQRLCMG